MSRMVCNQREGSDAVSDVNGPKYHDTTTKSRTGPAALRRALIEVDDVDGDWTLKLLDVKSRIVLWSICMKLKADEDGLPAQACRLLERYLAHKFQNMPENADERQMMMQSLLYKMPLLMASCTQLATKMMSSVINVTPTVVRQVLTDLGTQCTVQEIIQSEFEVFSVLGFKVPLWTSEQVMELIAEKLGLKPLTVEALKCIMNITELRRNALDELVRWAASSTCPAYGKCTVRTSHMIAGIISAGAIYLRLNIDGKKLNNQLAQLTDVCVEYINCISNSIITDILVDV